MRRRHRLLHHPAPRPPRDLHHRRRVLHRRRRAAEVGQDKGALHARALPYPEPSPVRLPHPPITPEEEFHTPTQPAPRTVRTHVLRSAAFHVAMLIVGRILLGLGVGMADQAGPMLLSEFAPYKYRGMFNCLFQEAVVFGILVAQVTHAARAHARNRPRLLSPCCTCPPPQPLVEPPPSWHTAP